MTANARAKIALQIKGDHAQCISATILFYLEPTDKGQSLLVETYHTCMVSTNGIS